MPKSRPGADAAPAVTPVAQDYLKLVWNAQEWSDAPVTTTMLAERLGVGASTVSETVRRLTDQGLLTHAPYAAIELTDAGRALAVAMVRRHRLLETFLVEELGYGWDEVHDEAEVLEHAVSDRLVDRIDARLGHPSRDPHGDPIPAADGRPWVPDGRTLDALGPGSWVVVRISDADPELLRYFASVGLAPDAHVEVVERRDVVGVVAVRVGDRTVELGDAAARAVWLAPRRADADAPSGCAAGGANR